VQESASSFLRQSCHLRGTDSTSETEKYTCQSSAPFACTEESPKKKFVCYEAENECFRQTGAGELGFQTGEGLGNQWVMGFIPPGVRVVSYGVDAEAPLVGRNPKFLGPKQRLYWNGTFFDRTKLPVLPSTTSVLIGFESVGTYEVVGQTGGRRLLQKNTDATPPRPSPGEYPGTVKVAIKNEYGEYWDLDIKDLKFDAAYPSDANHGKSCNDLTAGRDYQWIAIVHTIPSLSTCKMCGNGGELMRLQNRHVEYFWDSESQFRLCASSTRFDCCEAYEAKDATIHDMGFISCGIQTAEDKCTPEQEKQGYVVESRVYAKCTSFLSSFCVPPPIVDVWGTTYASVSATKEFTANIPIMTWNVSNAIYMSEGVAKSHACVAWDDETKPQECTMFRTIDVGSFAATAYPPWLNCMRPNEEIELESENNKIDFLNDLLNKGVIYMLNAIGMNRATYDNWINNRYGFNMVTTDTRHYRENFFRAHMERFQNTWFDYSFENTPHHRVGTDTNTVASEQATQTSFYFPAKYKSFSLELMEDFTCLKDTCGAKWALEVRQGLYKCIPCSISPSNYCTGRHDCGIRSLASAADSTSTPPISNSFQAKIEYLPTRMQQMDLTQLFSKLNQKRKLSTLEAARMLFLALILQFKEARKNVDMPHETNTKVYASVTSEPLSTTTSWAHPASWDFKAFTTSEAVNWETTTGDSKYNVDTGMNEMDMGACLEDGALETAQVLYNKCSNQQQLEHLREGVDSSYNKTGGVILQSSHGIIMPVNSQQLLSESLLAWSLHNRNLRDQYMEWLFTLDLHCATNRQSESVCTVAADGGSITLFNPWVGGDFSVEKKCDMRWDEENSEDVIDSRGNKQCTPGGRFGDFHDSQVATCESLDGVRPGTRVVPKKSGANICKLDPQRNTTCGHRQGLMGGYTGRRANTLYYPQPTLPTAQQGGVFVAPRVAAFRRTASSMIPLDTLESSLLKIHPDDIAGHHMRFVITEDDILRVDELLLTGVKRTGALSDRVAEAKVIAGMRNPHASFPRGGATSWLQWDESSEHLQNMLIEPDITEGTQHWTCPLRQRLFLSGMNARFRPSLPNGRRAAVMFRKHRTEGTQHYRSHTVQQAGASHVHINATIRTTNGFCYCQQESGDTDAYGQCRQPVQSADRCGFLQTLASLHDTTWRFSQVQKRVGGDTCVEQLDWPYTGGKLRDGRDMSHERVSNRSECNLLDRMHDFQYRYTHKSLSTTTPNSYNADTLTMTFGDCHSARVFAARADEGVDFLQHKCYPVTGGRNSTHLQIQCTPTSGAPYLKVLSRLQTHRRSSQSPRPRAVRCSQCAAPPKFFDATGTNETAPESSFGVLMREHSERVIAGTVRKQLERVLCSAGDTNCDRLHRVLNVSSWVPGEFWDKFLTNVGALFLETVSSGASQTVNDSVYSTFERAATNAADAYDSDKELWNTPWVWCTRMQPTCTSVCESDTEECSQVCTWPTVDNTTESGTPHTVDGCTGTIPKETWLNPETRGDACVQKMVELQASMTLTAAVDVCDMDRDMDELCKVIHAARNEIFSTNCFASGVCYAERFYYQPSIYSASNQEFIRSTVENFYVQINESSCPEKDVREAMAYKLNQQNVNDCPATSLEAVVIIIQGLRSILDKCMRIMYFAAMICVTILRFLVDTLSGFIASTMDLLTAELGRWFMLFIEELGAMWKAMADMIFELVMNTGFGQMLTSLVQAMCQWINWCRRVFVFGAYCPVVLHIEEELDTVGEGFVASQLFAGIGQGLLDAASDMRKSRLLTCSDDTLLTCIATPVDGDSGPAFLPVSTRCWSTYVSSLGDANSLSCSAADTCLTANLGGDDQYGSEQQMCATCESTAEGFTRFGCDLVRKQCKCNVQTLVRSPCVNHEQCSTTVQNDATCDLIDHALDINTFGTTPCKQCSSRPICMVGLGERVGYCACSQKSVEFASCALTDIGKSMFPPVDALCLVTIGATVRDAIASSALYTTSYNELAAARCSMIDQAQRFCTEVVSGAWNSGFYVVGVSGLQQSNRRLLSSATMLPSWSFVIDASLFDEVMYNSTWSDVQYEPCRSVPLLYDSNYTLGIADKALLISCVHWRAAAREVIQTMRMPQDFPDTFLLSIDDFTRDVLSNYHHCLTLFVRHPHAVLRALMHSPFMHPVRTVMRQFKQWVIHMQIEVHSISEHYKETNDTLATSVHSRSVFSSIGYMGTVYNTFAKYYGLQQHNISAEFEDGIEIMQQQMNGSLMMFMDSSPLRYTLRRKARHQTLANQSESMNMSGAATTLLVVPSSNTRRLLQDTTNSFLQRMEETQLYSWDVALGGGTTQIIGGSIAREYLEGPVGWPPKYVYWDSDGQCPILENTWGVVMRSSNIMYRYYTNAGPPQPIVIRGITNVLNTIKPVDVVFAKPTTESDDSSLLSVVKKYLLQAATDLGITDIVVFGTFKLFSANAENFFKCDIDAVVFCSAHRIGLFESGVVVALVLFVGTVIIAFVVPASPMSSIAIIVFLSITIYFAFGISPVCAPMVPTCLLSELITTIETIFPVTITIPRSLHRTPTCLTDYNTHRSLNGTFTDSYDASKCIVSCSETPFNFIDWYSNTAWIICDLSPWCTSTREWVQSPGNWLVALMDQIMGSGTSDSLIASLWRSSVVIQSQDASIITAYRWCCVFTMWNVIPYLLVILFLIPAIPFSITIVISFVNGLIRVLIAYFTLSHTFTKISGKDIPGSSDSQNT
ncbi:hypothetical protein T484DRAFT_1757294, partial [Baffinella frigidus]